MDDLLLTLLNGAVCGLISIAMIGAVVSQKVRDGIVVKIGLICIAAGFGAIALRLLDTAQPADAIGLGRSLLMVNAGIAVVILGYLVRKCRAPHRMRRSSDWVSRADRQPMKDEA